MALDQTIVPMYLSGGSGSRLWPMSRPERPKQLLPLLSEQSLLQESILRWHGHLKAEPLIVASEEHRFLIAEQVRELGLSPLGILLEPVARNTALACAVGALAALERDPAALLLVQPADHQIKRVDRLVEAVEQAAVAARGGYLVAFGVEPTRAETGYGYIRSGTERLFPGVSNLLEFVEKPAAERAEAYLASGNYLWNTGLYLFGAARLLEELEQLAPEILQAAQQSFRASTRDLDFIRLETEAYAGAPTLSIDVAVMERTRRAAVVPCKLDWTDVGTWGALWQIANKDAAGNSMIGPVVSRETDNCYFRSEGPLIAASGVSDLIVVATEESVLIVPRQKSEEVKQLVLELQSQHRSDLPSRRVMHRPWGSYQTLHLAERFQVKCIVVKPGGRLSLQRHHHRAEHWVVVRGTARVTRGDEVTLLFENESIHIPIGETHRLENPGKIPLSLIEVQSGSYLGEDDIIRLDDVYGRH